MDFVKLMSQIKSNLIFFHWGINLTNARTPVMGKNNWFLGFFSFYPKFGNNFLLFLEIYQKHLEIYPKNLINPTPVGLLSYQLL